MSIETEQQSEKEADEAETEIEGRMFLDALLNGDEKLNKFAKLIDARFDSMTRRVNRRAQEIREEIRTDRDEARAWRETFDKDWKKLTDRLGPALDLASIISFLKRSWPALSAVGTVVGGLVTVWRLGILG